MSWVAVGMIGGSTALSLYREKKKAEATNKWNQGQAEVTKWSPWTGIQGQVKPQFEDAMGAGLQGALAGAQTYGAMKGAGLFAGSAPPPASPGVGGPTSNSLGSDAMVADLGSSQYMDPAYAGNSNYTAASYQSPQMGSSWSRMARR